MSIREFDYQTMFEKTKNGELEELAVVYHQLGCNSVNVNRAIAFYKRSIAINLYYQPTDYDLLSASYSNIGALLKKRSDYKEALRWYQRALNIDLRNAEVNQLKIANHYNDIGCVLKDQGDYKEAMEYFHRALDNQTKSTPLKDLMLVKTYHNLGSVYCLMDELSSAFHYYEKALEILEAYFPLQQFLLIYTYNKIGSIYYLQENYTAAFSCQAKALEMQEKTVSPDYPSLAVRHFNMALALEGLREYEQATDHVTRAIEILRQTRGTYQHKIRRYQQYLDKLRERE